MDAASALCVGCFRTLDEITAWASADDTRRATILAATSRRRLEHPEFAAMHPGAPGK